MRFLHVQGQLRHAGDVLLPLLVCSIRLLYLFLYMVQCRAYQSSSATLRMMRPVTFRVSTLFCALANSDSGSTSEMIGRMRWLRMNSRHCRRSAAVHLDRCTAYQHLASTGQHFLPDSVGRGKVSLHARVGSEDLD